jgi:hypothetical protein
LRWRSTAPVPCWCRYQRRSDESCGFPLPDLSATIPASSTSHAAADLDRNGRVYGIPIALVAPDSAKGLTATNGHLLHSHVHVAAATPFVIGVTIAIGFATYGNEPDLFRYAKPRVRSVIPPLAIGLFVGQLLSPAAGWIIAAREHSGDIGQSVSGAVSFSLFGLSILAFLLATATQVAVNDANYYESLNAGQNLLGGWSRWRRIYTCLLIAAGGGSMAWWVPQNPANFFRAVTFLAVTVPTTTVIMYTDQLLLPRLFGIRRRLDRVPSWNQAALANWPAIVSLLVAIAFGSYGSGILPGQSGSPLNGWGSCRWRRGRSEPSCTRCSPPWWPAARRASGSSGSRARQGPSRRWCPLSMTRRSRPVLRRGGKGRCRPRHETASGAPGRHGLTTSPGRRSRPLLSAMQWSTSRSARPSSMAITCR